MNEAITIGIDIAKSVFQVHAVDAAGEPVIRRQLRRFAQDNRVSHSELWWAHEGHRSIRVGDWKLVAAKGAPWELFNLKVDRT